MSSGIPKDRVTKVPLEKMPLIDTPIERIAVEFGRSNFNCY